MKADWYSLSDSYHPSSYRNRINIPTITTIFRVLLTSITMSRTAKMILRNGIKPNKQPFLLSILQWSYNGLHNISVAQQSKATTDKMGTSYPNTRQYYTDEYRYSRIYNTTDTYRTSRSMRWDTVLIWNQMIGYVQVYISLHHDEILQHHDEGCKNMEK